MAISSTGGPGAPQAWGPTPDTVTKLVNQTKSNQGFAPLDPLSGRSQSNTPPTWAAGIFHGDIKQPNILVTIASSPTLDIRDFDFSYPAETLKAAATYATAAVLYKLPTP